MSSKTGIINFFKFTYEDEIVDLIEKKNIKILKERVTS